MIKYCVNCEDSYNPGALANSPDNSDFCSKECEEAFLARADKLTLELVSGVNPEIRPANLTPPRMGLSNSKATDILNNSKVVDAVKDNKPVITDEARKAIENLLNTGQK